MRLLTWFFLFASLGTGAPAPKVSIVTDPAPGLAARHGIAELKSALERQHAACEEVRSAAKARGQILVMAGLAAGDGAAAQLRQNLGESAPEGAEALLVRTTQWQGKKTLLVAGGGDRGLMYALLDVAERVGWAASADDPFRAVKDVRERPAAPERALSIYTMSRSHFESFFFNEDYWARYFDMLARDRFNSFVLIFGYEASGYFAPAYPYFFDVPGFPDVRVVGLTREQQQRNLRTLNRIVRMAHERGVNVTIGLWDHIYRGGVQGPKELAEKPAPGLVWGVTQQNLTTYIPAALAQFFKEIPDVDALQFRMHGESGIKPEEMRPFWESMYQVMKQSGGRTRFDLRLKDFPDDLIYRAADLGLNFRLTTKYWMEQMGLPFHPTHISSPNQFDRRHSYADVLRYPQRYKMHWELWTGGTTRILLWGDPDFARRFADSTHLYDGDGFQVNEPLATKMAGHPHDMPTFALLNAPYRYYDYEFERYWHFYQVFGRIGYNPATPAEVWDREFERRLGKQAGPVAESALHQASWILPRIVASSYPYSHFPTTRGWAEKQRMDDLPVYAKMEPSDTQQFQSPSEAARSIVEGAESGKMTPETNSRWFERTGSEVLAGAEEAERRGAGAANKELASTLVDLRILGNLALYHARRIRGGLAMALYQRTADVNALDDAIALEKQAAGAWEGIVKAAGDVYADDIRMGVPFAALNGHWRDELAALRKGIAALEQQRDGFHPEPRRPVARFTSSDVPRSGVFTREMPSGDYELAVAVDGGAKGAGPMWIEANGIDYSDTFQVPAGGRVEKKIRTAVTDGKLYVVFDAPSNGRWSAGAITVTRDGPAVAHVPVRKAAPGADLAVRATVDETAARVRLVYGTAEAGFAAAAMTPAGACRYRAAIPASRVVPGLRYFIEAEDKDGRRGRYPAQGAVPVTVSADGQPPAVTHQPVASAPAGQSIRITANVEDPSGVKWVRLRYRAVNQHQDFRTLPMLATGEKNEYRAEVPAAEIDPRWDFMYLIEAMDNAGNGRVWPDLERETPYVVVKLAR